MFTRQWFRIFGPPGAVISDSEGALTAEAWGRWCDRHGSKRVLLSEDEHGWLIERHNGLLRGIVNRM